jgi:uncharacterized protein YkwD
MIGFRYLLIVLLVVAFGQRVLCAQTEEQDKQDSIPATAPPEILSSPEELNEAASEIIKLTNEFRQEEKLPPVTIHPKLAETADYFVNYMATEYKYGHKADGKTPSERAKKYGYDYCLLTENIAYQYSSFGFSPAEVAERFTTAWKESPDHRKNMLDPDVTELGVAVGQSKKTGYYFAVQMFGRPTSLRIEFTIFNRTATTIHYESGERELTLPPGYSRTHFICRPYEIKLYSVDAKVPNNTTPPKQHLIAKFKPVRKASYAIVAKSGKFSLQTEKP